MRRVPAGLQLPDVRRHRVHADVQRALQQLHGRNAAARGLVQPMPRWYALS